MDYAENANGHCSWRQPSTVASKTTFWPRKMISGTRIGSHSSEPDYLSSRFRQRAGIPKPAISGNASPSVDFIEIPDLAEGDFDQFCTISGQLRVIERVANEDPVWLIGSSLGGYLAALYAARHPEAERTHADRPAFDFIARWRERLGPMKR